MTDVVSDVSLDVERQKRLLNISLQWLNARRAELGHKPLTTLPASSNLVTTNLPDELEPEIQVGQAGRRLFVIHGGERISCAVPPIVAECEALFASSEDS